MNKASDFHLQSPVFQDGGTIPMPYTCKGQSINPPLNFLNPPAGTASYTLILHDPDAVNGDFLHWILWDIPSGTESILPSSVPVGAVQGNNGGGSLGYTGPCPPKGTGVHRYIFELYALDKSLDLESSAGEQDVRTAMDGHVVGQATLTGVFAAET